MVNLNPRINGVNMNIIKAISEVPLSSYAKAGAIGGAGALALVGGVVVVGHLLDPYVYNNDECKQRTHNMLIGSFCIGIIGGIYAQAISAVRTSLTKRQKIVVLGLHCILYGLPLQENGTYSSFSENSKSSKAFSIATIALGILIIGFSFREQN